MSDKSRVTIQVSDTRSVIIFGTRNGRAVSTTKAVCTDYQGWVLLLGANGKVYSPHVTGIHWANLSQVSDRQELLLRGLHQLGVITADEVEGAVAKGKAAQERRERTDAVWQLRESASKLGIVIPAGLERKLVEVRP